MGGPSKFYSYLWLRKNGTPYYVGKGQGARAFKRRERRLNPPSTERIIVFPMESESLAFESEMALIELFGRKNNGTGMLRNLTDGGEGPTGLRHSSETIDRLKEIHKGKVLTAQHREAIRLSMLGRSLSEEHREKLRGRAFSKKHRERLKIRSIGNQRALGFIHSAESRAKMSVAKSGRTLSDETKKRISEAKKGSIPWNKGLRAANGRTVRGH